MYDESSRPPYSFPSGQGRCPRHSCCLLPLSFLAPWFTSPARVGIAPFAVAVVCTPLRMSLSPAAACCTNARETPAFSWSCPAAAAAAAAAPRACWSCVEPSATPGPTKFHLPVSTRRRWGGGRYSDEGVCRTRRGTLEGTGIHC